MSKSKVTNTTSSRLSKAEANASVRLNSLMAKRFNKLQGVVKRNWSEYQNLNQLPNQKAIALSKILDENLNITPDSEKVFRELYKRSQSEGVSLAKDLLKQIGVEAKDTDTNDFVDFWSKDSSGRLGDWGQAFKRDARAIFELGMSQGWSESQVIDALTSRFGQLQFQAERIIRTASISTLNSTASAYYKKAGVELYQWVATLDDRLCIYCGVRHGNVYYLKDLGIPAHNYCRCLAVPVRRRDLLYDKIDREYWKQQKAEGLEQLKQAGGKPNYGVSPFEKKAGSTEAPIPIWQPDKGYSYGEKSKTRRVIDEK